MFGFLKIPIISKTSNMLWPFKKVPVIELENLAVKRAIARVIDERSHYGFTGHPRVKQFEQQLSRELFDGIPILGVNSGSDAIVLALKILGIGSGDEVIVPAFSFISTVSTVGWIGATPIFIDITARDYAIDPDQIEKKITPRTKAIIVAHLFGHPAIGIQQICDIAKKHNLSIIEDTAQSLGAKIKIDNTWRMAGTIGNIGCLSFSSTKPFSAPGNGGALILRDKNQYEIADKMRFYGAERPYFEYPVIGINAKLHEVQAAALLAKLNFLDYWLNHRKKLASLYRENLSGLGDLLLPAEHPQVQRTWYRYVVRTKQRDRLFAYLKRGLGTKRDLWPTLHYPVPLPYFSVFKKLGYQFGDFPVSDEMSRETISLPVTSYVNEKNALNICDLVKEFFANSREHS